jgi:hypothetical protein
MTEAEIAEPLPRNPFRLALLVTSLVAIAGGGLALWHRLTDNQDGSFDTEHVALFVQQLLDALLGPLLTGGLIGLCLWLALGAVRRRDDA